LADEAEAPGDTVSVQSLAAVGPEDGAFDFDVTGADDLGELAATMPPDLLPTPLAPSGILPLVRLSEHLTRRPRQPSGTLRAAPSVRRGLGFALALVAAVLGGFALLHLLLSGR
jgi:hypothetical protein